MNKPEIRCQPCGSAHGHCAAKGLAKIYSAIVTGQEVNGKPLLSSESVERFMTPVMTGFDKCFAMPFMMAVGTLVFNVVEDGDFDNVSVFTHTHTRTRKNNTRTHTHTHMLSESTLRLCLTTYV